MTTKSQDDILRKVRALIAKADSTPFDGEADVFRAKADELMAAYHIEEWRLAQTEPQRSALSPVRRDMDFSWYADRKTDGVVKTATWQLFLRVAGHCNCAVAHTHVDWYKETIPVYGLPADLDYLNMLFTSLILQMGSRLKPEYDPNQSLGHNIYRARVAGMKYAQIALWLGKPEWEQNGKPVDNGIMAREYKRYMKDAGIEEAPVVQIKNYVESYLSGWVTGVGTILKNQRDQQTSEDSSGSLLPALRDVKERALDAMRADLGEQQTTSRSVSHRQRKVDWEARARGTEHGKQARVSRDRDLRSQKELR